jgi:TolB-like protein
MERINFGVYGFDVETAQLWSGAQEIRLTPKAAAVLKELVKHAGTPVSKEELFAAVWSGTSVSDDALISCVQELRSALKDDAKRPHFIETRHRRGYRFIAQLAGRASDNAGTSSPAADVTAIAVLPFTDMSRGRDQGYLCDGLAEELIDALTREDGLRVAARTASFQFRGAGADVRAIGRQLAVGTLVQGSLRIADDRLRVTVQLVDATTGYHRWSQRFDRTLNDVFAIEDEIAETVARSLRRTVVNRFEAKAALQRNGNVVIYDSPCADGTTLPVQHGRVLNATPRWQRAT